MGDSNAAWTLPDVAPSDEGQVASLPEAVEIPRTVLYGECQRNFEASTGGHATDGCEGFLPLWTDNGDLRCARCSCHRSFHRREEELGNMLVPIAYIPALPLAWCAPTALYYQASPPLPRQEPPSQTPQTALVPHPHAPPHRRS